jgi:hypothetical protein
MAAFVLSFVASRPAHGARQIQGSVGQVTQADGAALGQVGFRIFSALPGGETNINDNNSSCRNVRCLRNYITNSNLNPGGYVGNAEATQVYNGDLDDQHFYELVDANMNNNAANHIGYYGVSGVTTNHDGVGSFLVQNCPPPTATNCFERLDNRFQAPPLTGTVASYGGAAHTIRAIGGLNPIPNVRIDSATWNTANLSWNDPPTYAGAMRPSSTAPAPPSPVLGVRLWKFETGATQCNTPTENDPGWTSVGTFDLGETSTQVTIDGQNCTFFALTVRFIGPGGLPNEIETFRVGVSSEGVLTVVADCFEGYPCDDDGSACTLDVCHNNQCTHPYDPSRCDDGNPCTFDACISQLGDCANEPREGSCSDGNACTANDACSNGICVGGPPATCNDGNACTNDACVAPGGCTFTNNSAACDDGNGCTVNDVCAGGGCGGTTVPPPAEVAHDRFTNRTTFTWDAVANAGPGTVYDVARGWANGLPPGSGAGEICLASGITLTSLHDASLPRFGLAHWYLVRARNACGTGVWGWWSNGVPRFTAACP